MQTGLLWFDDTPNRDLRVKVEDAARRYWEKFGIAADTCYVNDAMLEGSEVRVAPQVPQNAPLRVVAASNILLHHFWVGVEDQRETAPSVIGKQ
jgi:hypothetical protein